MFGAHILNHIIMLSINWVKIIINMVIFGLKNLCELFEGAYFGIISKT
jgi:hypothetical protein